MILPSASTWLNALDTPTAHWRTQLDALYGPAGMPAESRTLLRSSLTRFVEHFGDTAVRVFRAPGRVNLRGMHVDTHGGYLDLMSHQRELFLVFSPFAPGRYQVINAAPDYPEVEFDTATFHGPDFDTSRTWEDFLASPTARAAIAERGHWGHYLLGAALRAEFGAGGAPLFGFKACVAGNIPPGAALSSSAALCVAAYGAICALNGRDNPPAPWILAARDAEWFSGARTGTSDQAACVLCRPDEICNVALLAEDFSLDSLRRVPFPKDHQLLVVNSCTRRSLSGAEQIAYSKNRFAYSMAMDVFRHEWAALSGDAEAAARLDRLSRIVTDTPEDLTRVYDVLLRVPEAATLNDLRTRYRLPALEEQYDRYFGNADPALRPTHFNLRGPLLYGIAESERARRFGDWLERGEIAAAAHAMNTGHNGDRVRTGGGATYQRAISPEALRAARDACTPLTEFPGDYGASSPALDALVDAARAGGALGAGLTGAGIAGCILALCRAEETNRVRAALLHRLRALDYAALAKRPTALSEEELASAIVINASPSGACEVPWP